jgi:hypothetical protein
MAHLHESSEAFFARHNFRLYERTDWTLIRSDENKRLIHWQERPMLCVSILFGCEKAQVYPPSERHYYTTTLGAAWTSFCEEHKLDSDDDATRASVIFHVRHAQDIVGHIHDAIIKRDTELENERQSLEHLPTSEREAVSRQIWREARAGLESIAFLECLSIAFTHDEETAEHAAKAFRFTIKNINREGENENASRD